MVTAEQPHTSTPVAQVHRRHMQTQLVHNEPPRVHTNTQNVPFPQPAKRSDINKQSNVITTRAGREIRKPNYLKDYA